jgi:hypothetical protein
LVTSWVSKRGEQAMCHPFGPKCSGRSSFYLVPILKDGDFHNVKRTIQPEARTDCNSIIHRGNFTPGQRRKIGSTNG